MADRIARINLVRGLLRELGFPIPVGARHVVVQTVMLLEKLPEPLRPVGPVPAASAPAGGTASTRSGRKRAAARNGAAPRVPAARPAPSGA
jgi:hypothetical protein